MTELNDEVMAAKIAAIRLAVPATSVAQLSKQLGVGPNVIKRVLNTQTYTDLLANTAKTEIAPILAKVKTDIYNLGSEAVRVLKEQLAENNLEAAKVVFKVMALDSPEDKPADNNLTVILPTAGVVTEKIIEVKQ